MSFEFGCIGAVLKHSFSKEIHGELADYNYELIELSSDELADFALKHNFKAVNVTIPYKEAIIPYLHAMDDVAKAIGAVNTVINRDGRLYGYNTDFYGLSALIEGMGVSLKGKKVIILGTGGTSKTAHAVATAGLARSVIKVSRSARERAISYDELYESHRDADIIINTTPSGMFPNIFDCPVDPQKFERLEAVADVIYNPLRTPLVLKAREMGIKAEGGLYMLVAQAYAASELFLGESLAKERLTETFKKLYREKENIVLIGMPASGKSTVGGLLAKELGRELIDTDTLIERSEGMKISDIFEKYGEKYFRDAEARVIKESSALCGKVIATGGGAILRKENVDALKQNGRLYFIDRPLSELIPTDTRPLSSTKEAIEERYRERYAIYTASADCIIDADCDASAVTKMITKDFLK